MSDQQEIRKLRGTNRELRSVLKHILEECEFGKEAIDQWGPLSLKTIALIRETLAHG